MLEILSTIGLTASALIVIGFLSYAMAETPRAAARGRRRSRRLVRARFAIGASGGARSRSRVRRSGALGLTVVLPVAALVQRLSSPLDHSGEMRCSLRLCPR